MTTKIQKVGNSYYKTENTTIKNLHELQKLASTDFERKLVVMLMNAHLNIDTVSKMPDDYEPMFIPMEKPSILR